MRTDISWALDDRGNIVSSRLSHFIDEADIAIDEDNPKDALLWYKKFGAQILSLLEIIAKNPEKVV